MSEEEIGALSQQEADEPQRHQDTIAELTSRLQRAETTVAQLEAELESQRQVMAVQKEQTRQHEGEASQLRQALTQAAAKYRNLLLASAPEVPQELVSGATLEEVDNSLAAAQALVVQIKQRLEAHQAQERVPAGSPTRGASDLSALSTHEKIAYGLGHSRQ